MIKVQRILQHIHEKMLDLQGILYYLQLDFSILHLLLARNFLIKDVSSEVCLLSSIVSASCVIHGWFRAAFAGSLLLGVRTSSLETFKNNHLWNQYKTCKNKCVFYWFFTKQINTLADIPKESKVKIPENKQV